MRPPLHFHHCPPTTTLNSPSVNDDQIIRNPKKIEIDTNIVKLNQSNPITFSLTQYLSLNSDETIVQINFDDGRMRRTVAITLFRINRRARITKRGTSLLVGGKRCSLRFRQGELKVL